MCIHCVITAAHASAYLMYIASLHQLMPAFVIGNSAELQTIRSIQVYAFCRYKHTHTAAITDESL